MTAAYSSGAPGGQPVVTAAHGEADAAGEPFPRRPDEHDPTSLDAFFGLLKNERRRRVVRYLDEVSPTTTLSDLAEHIAAAENDKPKRALNAQERKRVYIQLYQYHLPAMDKVGVIAFDGDRGTVERTPKADHLSELLDAGGASPSSSASSTDGPRQTGGDRQSEGSDRRPTSDRRPSGGDPQPPRGDGRPSRAPVQLDTWSVYYLGLGLVGAGLFGFQWSSPASSLVDGAVVGVLLMATVSCLVVRAARGSASRRAADDGGPTSEPASAGDAGRGRAPAGGLSPRGTIESVLPSRAGRPVVEGRSSNGTTGGSAD